jgi:hypothetical protein
LFAPLAPEPHGAIGSYESAVLALIEASTLLFTGFGEELFDLLGAHVGELVDVLLAESAEADGFVAGHGVPVGITWTCDLQANSFGSFHFASNARVHGWIYCCHPAKIPGEV